MQDGNAPFNIGDLAKPVNTLIEKISNAIGALYAPRQIKRIAKAEAEASKIKAIAEVETSKIQALSEFEIKELQQRALYRFITEETKKQINIESITGKSFKDVKEDAKPENMENDWITNFFDKCKLISDEEMQILWAKVLAGEANNPGSYSTRTIDFLSTMDKRDAQIFQNFCSFCWFINTPQLLIYDIHDEIYNKNNTNFFSDLHHLHTIGLISYESLTGYIKIIPNNSINTSYFDIPISIEFLKKSEKNEILLGKVSLSQIGIELLKISNSKPIPEFVDYVLKKWHSFNIITYSPYPKMKVPINTYWQIIQSKK